MMPSICILEGIFRNNNLQTTETDVYVLLVTLFQQFVSDEK
jgi:hypothetical protein